MYSANVRVDGREGNRRESGCLAPSYRTLPSLSAIPSANDPLMSSLSRIDLLHHYHYHLTLAH